MTNMLFFLKFKSQLRRTRPELVQRIEECLIRAVTDAEGKITGERPCLTAVFDEENLGFALDLFILIEKLKKSMDASKEFYGYALVFSREPPKPPDRLCRFLACGGGGVFLDRETAEKFVPYAVVEKPADWLKERGSRKYGSGGFYRVKKLKTFTSCGKNNSDGHEDIIRLLGQGHKRNTLILGSVFSLKQRGLYKYCKKLNGDFPALTIRFGSGGISALIDAWSSPIRALSGESAVEEIDGIWEMLFRERIRDEVSSFYARSARRFMYLLLDLYIIAANKRKRIPVLIVENIHLAGNLESDLLLELVAGKHYKSHNTLLILGTCADSIDSETFKQWEQVFTRIIKTDNEKQTPFNFPELPMELWEITYAISLFGRFFSPGLFQRLFEEEEKNSIMIARAFSLLYTFGVTDTPREPWPISGQITERAEHILGERTIHIKAMVRRRLLSWVSKLKINPCFRLLAVIDELGGAEEIDDQLILKTISSDLVNGTTAGIESAVKSGSFQDITGEKRAEPVRYIFETARALLTGDMQEICRVFKEPPPDCDSFPVLKGRILVNLCSYHSGVRDKTAALESAKEAILMGQNKDNLCLPNAYRLFSLVSLSKQQLSETIDYLGFALANAETSGNYHEMGICAYYAAVSQFLYGNVYKAAVFARKSIDHSLASGCPGWADRARFLEGRLAFEIGRYQEAQRIFTVLRRDPFDRMTDEKDRLLAAWIYRIKAYSQNPMTPKPEEGGCDADLFEVEAAYLAGSYQKAVELSSSLTNPFSKENFLYTEQPDWRSGFAQCEHLYFSQGEVWDRMVCVFHSLALCRLSTEGGEEAMHNMQRILRNERLSEMDPWDAFYFYAWYRILEQTGAEIVDMNTAVSMAFKRLQRRASRTEDVETRRQYLTGPRWNRELSLAAKEFKLI